MARAVVACFLALMAVLACTNIASAGPLSAAAHAPLHARARPARALQHLALTRSLARLALVLE